MPVSTIVMQQPSCCRNIPRQDSWKTVQINQSSRSPPPTFILSGQK